MNFQCFAKNYDNFTAASTISMRLHVVVHQAFIHYLEKLEPKSKRNENKKKWKIHPSFHDYLH